MLEKFPSKVVLTLIQLVVLGFIFVRYVRPRFAEQSYSIVHDMILDASGLPVEGKPEAAIAIVEFSEFECPFCRDFAVNTLPALRQRYIEDGQVKHYFKNYPLVIHEDAFPLAILGACAAEQGRFWDFHDMVFRDTKPERYVRDTSWTVPKMDRTQLYSCINTNQKIGKIRRDIADGEAVKIQGTPTFFIGLASRDKIDVRYFLRGSQSTRTFQALIDGLISKVGL